MLSPRISARQRLGLTAQMRGQLRILALPTDLLAEEIAIESADNPFLAVDTTEMAPPSGWDGNFDIAATQDGLIERLTRQIALQRLDATTEAAALYLVGELREDGYLDTELGELAAQTGVPLALFESGLAAIQRCEPTGVGARDLAECLALQLADHDVAPDLARRICRHLEDLAEERFGRVARALGLEIAEIRRLDALLRGLSAVPVQPEEAQPVQTRIPELIVETSRSGAISVSLNPAALPRVRQEPLPRKAATNPEIDGLHRRAGWLVAALAARQATLLRIGRLIAERQARFFLGGHSSLVPDSRTAVASYLGLHLSTLSRAVAGKALVADGRIHPLSIFFSRPLPGPDGKVSAFDVQLRIRSLIAAEDCAHPLADDDIRTKLKDEGVDIARRTVAKYRKCMRIPSSYERRRRQVSPETRAKSACDSASSPNSPTPVPPAPAGPERVQSAQGEIMRFQISGKQIDVGESLQTHVKSELAETVEKYSQRPTDASVIFSRNAHEFLCESTVHLSTGLTAAAKGNATEIYAAFEACRERMDKQLRRYKRRLKDHHRERVQPVEFAGAPLYVLAANETEDHEPALQPMIIAEMETKIPSLSVGEAVMQMELSGTQFLVFRNEKHGGVNVVHRRDDGNVGWIDPSNGS